MKPLKESNNASDCPFLEHHKSYVGVEDELERTPSTWSRDNPAVLFVAVEGEPMLMRKVVVPAGHR